ncbi:MAG: hypothetical protein LBF58_08780 [Deltaproteobacteria bacterium]|jgi:uncharacterized protein YecT (DUF1311 family)|nr:hypothetical protein [Deltaproteobacteria bacterium]
MKKASSFLLFALLAVALCLPPGQAAMAQSSFKPLSNDEYEFYVSRYPHYAAAEERLNRAWKNLKLASPQDRQDAYLKDQRNWVKNGRHLRAGQLHGQSHSRVDAFTLATEERADYLEEAVARESGNLRTPPPRVPIQVHPSPFIGTWNRTGVPRWYQGTIEIDRVTDDHLVFSFFGMREQNTGELRESAYFESPNVAVYRERDSQGAIHEVRFTLRNQTLSVSGDPPFGTFGLGVSMEGRYVQGPPRYDDPEPGPGPAPAPAPEPESRRKALNMTLPGVLNKF